MRFLWVFFLGCKGTPPCEEAATVTPEIVLGLGARDVVAVQDGTTMELDYGNQGGRHVWVGIRTRGLDPGTNPIVGAGEPGPEIHILYVDNEGETVAYEGPYRVPFQGTPLDAELLGIQLRLDYSYTDAHPDVELVEGVLSATAIDSCGTEVHTAVNAKLEI